ncbi:MAG: hypothetical protein MZV65_52830 [Chromatiales bacterium]|nr:hypothetical protein [Chromatiales bacterium]
MQMLTGNLAPCQGRITVAGHDLLEDPRAAKARNRLPAGTTAAVPRADGR